MAQVQRRADDRRRCYLSARLFFNGNLSSLDAVVRNISTSGAKIHADLLSIVPPEFEVQIHGGVTSDTRHRARRVWMGEGCMGVVFDTAH